MEDVVKITEARSTDEHFLKINGILMLGTIASTDILFNSCLEITICAQDQKPSQIRNQRVITFMISFALSISNIILGSIVGQVALSTMSAWSWCIKIRILDKLKVVGMGGKCMAGKVKLE